jgi:hypothetical protein
MLVADCIPCQRGMICQLLQHFTMRSYRQVGMTTEARGRKHKLKRKVQDMGMGKRTYLD